MSSTPWNRSESEFSTPDLADNMIVGSGGRDIGDDGGEETHTLTVAEQARPRHIMTYQLNAVQSGTNRRMVAGSTSWYGSYQGDDEPHENMPPFLVLDWYIHI